MPSGYHVCYPVRTGRATNGQELAAPTFNGATWRADRAGSLTCEPDEMPCELPPPKHADVTGQTGWQNGLPSKASHLKLRSLTSGTLYAVRLAMVGAGQVVGPWRDVVIKRAP